MSSVRMCDRCGSVFSENEDGWQNFEGSTIKRDADGKQFVVTVRMDACRACAIVPTVDTPALTAPSKVMGKEAFTLDDTEAS